MDRVRVLCRVRPTTAEEQTRGERVVASAAFVADYGEGLPLAEGMVCVGVEGKVGRQMSGAMVKAVANRLSAGLDRWEGRRLATLRWERDCAPPTATLSRIALSLSTLESAASKIEGSLTAICSQ